MPNGLFLAYYARTGCVPSEPREIGAIPINDEALRELQAKLERGAAQADRGELLDGDEVFEELREMIEERRRAKAATL